MSTFVPEDKNGSDNLLVLIIIPITRIQCLFINADI